MKERNGRMLVLAAISVVSLLSGCCLHQPLLVKDQAMLIKTTDRRLNGLADTVQAKIKDAGTVAALVVLPDNATTAPLIFPTSSPLVAAADHQVDVAAGQSCFFVSKRTTPVAPISFNCAALAQDGKEIGEASAKIAQAEADVKTMGLLVGKMSSLVEYHDHQLTALTTSLNTLIADYGQSVTAVDTNNKQIDGIIDNINQQFQSIETSLTKMQQQLNQIH